MALDKLVDSTRLDGALTATANAILSKTGGSSPLTWDMDDGFKDAVDSIPSGGTYQAKTNINPTTSSQTITPDTGYDALSSVQINAMPSGSASTPATTITANPTIGVSNSGLITATNSKTQSVTPTVSAGYVSSGTAGTITVSGSNTSQLTTQAAQTIHPSSSDQSIASGKYLTGTQTIKGVTTTNLTAGNIKNGVTVKIGDSSDDDCVTSVTGTYSGGGGGTTYTDYYFSGYAGGPSDESLFDYGLTITDLFPSLNHAVLYTCYGDGFVDCGVSYGYDDGSARRLLFCNDDNDIATLLVDDDGYIGSYESTDLWELNIRIYSDS